MYEEEVDASMIEGISGVPIEGIAATLVAQNRGSSPQELIKKGMAAAIARYDSKLMSDDQRVLTTLVDKFPVDIQTALSAKRARFEDARRYLRTVLTGAGSSLEALLASNVEKVGTTNIKANQLGVPTLVSRVRVAYGFTAASGGATDPGLVSYSNTPATLPLPVQNGELAITKNGTPMVTIPLSYGFNIAGSYAAVPGWYDCIVLPSKLFFNPDDTIGLVVKTPTGSSYAAGNHFLEITLIGTAVRAN